MNFSTYKKRILIVDDDPTSLKILESMLPAERYDVVKANDGKEALESAFEKPPDLILLDIMMPGIDGFEVTRKIKRDKRTKDVPVIIITSLDGSESRIKGLEGGAEELLSKPVHATELLARVSSMLRLKEYRDQLTIRTLSGERFGVISEPKEEIQIKEEELPQILLVEDAEVDAIVVEKALDGEPFQLSKVYNGKQAFSFVSQKKTDLILLDIILPDMDGFEICRRLKKDYKDIQVVIVTCLDDLESKIKGVELGADDFLVKPIVGRELKARVKTLMEKKFHLDSLRTHYQEALGRSQLDWLTGLYNHGYFQQFLGYELKRSLEQGFPVSLIMIDVDDFKSYNDNLGHSAGDAILREMGQVVRNSIREVDFAARYGGEEFAVVLPYVHRENAIIVAERIHKTLTSHDFFHDESIEMKNPTVSMGIAVFPEEASNKTDLIVQADSMLYRAKQNGKNQYQISEPRIYSHLDH
ncbi:MAG: response regulator [Candidatus Aminicenantes bacterium]|nr:MAG: response regulator [Candidatus Aminicenantes bacterium]